MQLDLEELKEYYSRLTDEGILAIQRDDLVDAAKMYYDAEIGRRGLAGRMKLNDASSNELRSADEDVFEGSPLAAASFASLNEAEVACGLIQSAGIPWLVDKPLYRRGDC